MANGKRLIDANVLLKRAYYEDEELVVTVEDIEKAPTVDAVEVVRCKDCKHRRKDGLCYMISGGPELVGVDDDFYCKCGKRKGDADQWS